MLNRWTLLSLLVATRAGAVITGPVLVDQVRKQFLPFVLELTASARASPLTTKFQASHGSFPRFRSALQSL